MKTKTPVVIVAIVAVTGIVAIGFCTQVSFATSSQIWVTMREHPEKYGWWINELESLGR
ncbi:MAG TPA: hypothetical protein VEH06_14430 [Candidatus Bathyarchaeia archaeon]|nr:hypothetical protein [Candidatus Bathyarchaeia archaeon]